MRATLSLAALLFATAARAEVKTERVEYTHNGTKFIGLIARDTAATGPRPGVLVFHEWWGLDDFAKQKAEQLAQLGYVAFAADVYGAGKVVDHPKDSAAMSGAVRKNEKEWRGRALAAMDVLKKTDGVDANNIAAIGYCFGGSTALQLALSGAELKAVSTFHAGLPKVTVGDAKAIKCQVLVSNGADDSFIPAPVIGQFKDALTKAGTAFEFDNYPGAVHSFAVPKATERHLDGMAYNENADTKSWAKTKELFARVFAK